MTPENLYKYLSSSRAQILEDGLIRFTQPSDLNDPFEFRMILKHVYTERELKKQVDEILEQEL